MPHQCTECDHVFPDGSKAMLSGCPDCGGNTFQFLPESAITANDSEAATTPTTPPTEDVPIDAAESRSNAASASPSPSNPNLNPTSDPGSVSGPASASGRRSDAEPESESNSDTNAGDSADSTDPSRKPPSRGPIGRATAAVRGWVRVDSSASAPVRPPDDRARADATEDDGNEHTTESDVDTDAGPGPGSPAEVGPEVESTASPESEAGREGEPETDTTASAGQVPPSGANGGRIAAEPTESADDRPDLDELRRELNEQFESIRIVAPGQYELNLMELYNREEYIIALREDGRYAIEAPETWLGRRADRD